MFDIFEKALTIGAAAGAYYMLVKCPGVGRQIINQEGFIFLRAAKVGLNSQPQKDTFTPHDGDQSGGHPAQIQPKAQQHQTSGEGEEHQTA